jgi:glycosyltransferase A (GT-A) superfamily protein (DUF2064 family)
MGHEATRDTRVVVFAKAPVPGEVKTRLVPVLDAVKAAMLHAALTERAVETALAAGDAAELCCAPDTGHVFFQDCAEEFGIDLSEQGPGDLGAGCRAIARCWWSAPTRRPSVWRSCTRRRRRSTITTWC